MEFKKTALILAMSLVAVIAFANSAPKEGGEGEGEAKKEGGKESGKESGALPEWVTIQAKIQTLRAKISAKDRSVRDLIKLKQAEKDPAKSRDIVKDLNREHHELREAVEDYDRQVSLLRYRFPEKGLKEERYKRPDPKSLEEMEKQVGMEGRLKQVSAKVRRQYGGTEAEKEPEKKPEPVETDSPKITQPAVLTK